MFEDVRLSNLAAYARLFVGIFTTLALLVTLWAMLVSYFSREAAYEDQGLAWSDYIQTPIVAENNGKSEKSVPKNFKALKGDIAEITEDSSAVLAPIWDTEHAGTETPVDSAALVEELLDQDSDLEGAYLNGNYRLRVNVSQAYLHLLGQTLVFFALGLVFVFTSVSPRVKEVVWWVFGVSIVLFAAGLTGQGCAWSLDIVQLAGGVGILAAVIFMAFRIYADLVKKRP